MDDRYVARVLRFVLFVVTRQDDGHDFGMDRASLRDLINAALPLARGTTENFWLTFVEQEQEMLYPLELFAALALECHGLSRCGIVGCCHLLSVETVQRSPFPRQQQQSIGLNTTRSICVGASEPQSCRPR